MVRRGTEQLVSFQSNAPILSHAQALSCAVLMKLLDYTKMAMTTSSRATQQWFIMTTNAYRPVLNQHVSIRGLNMD